MAGGVEPSGTGQGTAIDGEVVLDLDGHAASVPAARRTVQRWLLDRRVPQPAVERVRLVVTELADNAVRHARTPFRLRVTVHGESVRVEVADVDRRLPTPARPAPDAVSGRGLWLVSRLAYRWGAHPAAGGKIVWATVLAGGGGTDESALAGSAEPDARPCGHGVRPGADGAGRLLFP